MSKLNKTRFLDLFQLGLIVCGIVYILMWTINRVECKDACYPYESTYQYNKCFCDKSSKALKQFLPDDE